jgi:hypothetical protein
MMWVTIIDATVEALLLEVGKASTHPEKVSTKTKRYLCFFTLGMLVVYLPIHPWDASSGLVSREWVKP